MTEPVAVAALLCDADGNLFPSEEPAFVASADVTNAFLAEYGVPVRFEPEELRLATTGKNFRSTIADLAATHGVDLGPDDCERWVAEERRAVTRHLAAVLRPDPSVTEPLTRMARSVRLAAVSSSASARLAACFDATGLSELIPAHLRFSAEDSLPRPTSKPDPAVYRFACEAIGVAPAEALAVEDSVPGARSAVAAGIPTVGNLQFVPTAERPQRRWQLEEIGVRTVVTSWSQLEPMVVEAASVADVTPRQ